MDRYTKAPPVAQYKGPVGPIHYHLDLPQVQKCPMPCVCVCVCEL